MFFEKSAICNRITGLLFTLLLLMNAVMPVFASAANDVYEGQIILTGDFTNQRFDLSTSAEELFNLQDVVPGDSWQGRIHVQNRCKNPMEVSIISITNDLKEDSYLFDQLELDISIGKEQIYSGSYGKTEASVSDWYTVSPDKEITFDIKVKLPEGTGNEGQGRAMDSTWVFEARLPKPEAQVPTTPPVSDQTTTAPAPKPNTETVKTGEDLTESNSLPSTWIILLLLSTFAFAITFLRIRQAKNETVNKEDPES